VYNFKLYLVFLLLRGDWTSSLQNKCNVTITYVDFMKAFDSVSHEKLLYRLQTYGIDGDLLLWLKAFLSDRSHSTRVGQFESSKVPLKSGVVQGSGIGPLLFISFINELANILLQYKVTVKFFADDLKLYAEILSNGDAVVYQSALNELAEWADRWQLPIAFKKCTLLHIGSATQQETFFLGNHPLSSSSSCKDLGITVCNNLSPSTHINSIASSANQRANLILRAFVSRDIALLVRAFIVYVRPILEYNSVVWSPQTKGDIAVLENVQRRYTKRLPGLRHFSYKQRLEELNLISLELRRLHLDLIMCYKITFGIVKLCFEDFFQFSPNSTTRGHPYKLFVPRCATNVRKHFFSCRVVEPWNNLPCNVADFSSLNNFKRSLYLCNLDAYLLVHHD